MSSKWMQVSYGRFLRANLALLMQMAFSASPARCGRGAKICSDRQDAGKGLLCQAGALLQRRYPQHRLGARFPLLAVHLSSKSEAVSRRQHRQVFSTTLTNLLTTSTDKVVFPLGDYILADLQTFECRRRNKASTLLLSGIEPAVLIYVLNPSVESCASIATSCKDALEHFRYVCSTLGNLERCDVTFVLGDCAKMKHVIEDSTAESCKAGQLTLARVFSLEGATNDAASVLTAIVSDFETSAELLRAKAVRTIVVEHAVDANGGARVAKQLCTVLQEVQAERVSQAEQRLEREAKQTTVGSTEGFTTFIVALVPLVALLLYYTFRTKPLTQ